MKRFILILVGIILLGMLAGCDLLFSSAEPTSTPTMAVQDFTAKTPSGSMILGPQIVTTPTMETGTPRILSFDMPATLQTGAVIDIPLTLISGGDLSSLLVEISFPVAYFYLEDCDPNAAGVQVFPGALPGLAVVDVNEVTSEGLLRYRVSGLGSSEDQEYHILTVRLRVVAPAESIARADFVQATLVETNGNLLTIPTSPLMVQIVQGAAAAEPTPVIPTLPPPTETPLPTVVAVAVPTPEPTALPTPLPPAPLAGLEAGIPAGIYYRIQPGENLFRLSLRFGSTADEIARVNQIADVHFIPARSFLRIPVAPPVGQAAYLVSTGDTFYSTARHFGFTVNQLAAQNGIANPSYIQVGQWIVLRP